MPVKARPIHNNDAPWMSDKLKRSNKKKQQWAFQSGNSSEFKYYCNVAWNGRNVRLLIMIII